MTALPPDDDDRTMLSLPTRQADVPASPAITPAARENESNALREGDRVFEFEIIRVVGVGGFGIVYLAYDHSLQRNIALKEYMPSSLAERTSQAQVAIKSERHAETFDAGMRSFINEARLLAQFDHPSLVKVYRFWEANGTAYMVMPFYEGLTLKQALKAMEVPPGEAWLKSLLSPLLDALETLHHEQCFHRDIAPDNILMLADGRPLLLDFGAARRAITGMDQAFTVILKPGYAPIEQYADVAAMQQGAWTDIYALASVVQFAMTGKPPPPSVTRMISDAQVPLTTAAAGRFGEAFLQVLDRCLSVQPKDRPQSIATLRDQLQLESNLPTQYVPPSMRPVQANAPPDIKPGNPARSGTGVYLALGAVGVIVAGVAAYFLAASPASKPAGGDAKPITAPTAAGPAAAAVPAPTLAAASIADATAPAASGATAPATTLATPPLQPTALAASPMAAAPAGPIDAAAILDQIFEGRDRDHALTVSLPKPQVRIGVDRLQMSIRSAKAGYVYLLMVGTNRSDFTLLFPNAVDKDNNIVAGKTLDLPRKKWALSAFGPPGTDQFVVIVSQHPRRFRDAGIKQGELFGEFPAAAVAEAKSGKPGAPSVFAGRAECTGETPEPCTQSYGAAQFSIAEVAK